MRRTHLVLLLVIVLCGALWFKSTDANDRSPLLEAPSTAQQDDPNTNIIASSLNTMAPTSGKSLTQRDSPTGHRRLTVNPTPSALPDGNLKDKLAFLESAAYDGKPDLAYSLSSELIQCLNLPDGNTSRSPSDPSITAAERCRGLDSNDYKAGVDLLEYAASHGDANASYAYLGLMSIWMNHNPKLRFDEHFIAELRANTLSYLQRAATNGNVDSISQLAYVYQNGLIVDRDPIIAYAYMKTVAASGLRPGASRVLDLWRKDLTQDQLSSALKRSEGMRR